MKSTETYIYGLFEIGKEEEIRYVGKSNNPSNRIHTHISSTKKKNEKKIKLTHKEYWIMDVLKRGNKVGIRILENCDLESWSEREMYWISKLDNLTNTSPGGETGITGTNFKINYEECKEWLRQNYPNIKTRKDFLEASHRFPSFIPKSPNSVFFNWVSWGDFLNTGFVSSKEISKKYKSYEFCKTWIRENLDLSKKPSWSSLIEIIPEFIPKKPQIHFKNEWCNWKEFLGYDIEKNYVSYDECKVFVRSLGIKSSKEWFSFIKKNKSLNIRYPFNINKVYKDEFTSWTDFLGSSPKSVDINRELMSFQELKEYRKNILNFINTSRQWKSYLKNNRIKGVPINPQHVYKNKGWISWHDFLR